jgi:hypothetical protein
MPETLHAASGALSATIANGLKRRRLRPAPAISQARIAAATSQAESPSSLADSKVDRVCPRPNIANK